MKRIEIKENNLNMVYEITDENEIKLLHFSNLPFDENDINSCEGTASFRPVEVLLSGLNRPGERHGTKYTYTAPGYRLKYKDMIIETRQEENLRSLWKINLQDWKYAVIFSSMMESL